ALALTGQRHQLWRTVASPPGGSRPCRLARIRTVGKQVLVPVTAREDDDQAVCHQGGTRKAPLGRPGPGIRRYVMRPESLARGGVQTVEDAGAAQRVNATVSECWGSPRPSAGHRLPEAGSVLVRPKFLAGLGVVADDGFLLAALFLGVQPAVDDDEA